MDETLRAALRGYLAAGRRADSLRPGGIDRPEASRCWRSRASPAAAPVPFPHTFLRLAAAVADGNPRYDHVTYESGPAHPADGRRGAAGRRGGALLRASLRALLGPLLYPAGARLALLGGGAQRPGDYLRPADPGHLRGATPCRRTAGCWATASTCCCRRRCCARRPRRRSWRLAWCGPGRRTVVHLLCFARERRSESFDQPRGRAQGLDIVEDAVPLLDQRLAVKLPAAPRRATLQPHGAALPVEYRARLRPRAGDPARRPRHGGVRRAVAPALLRAAVRRPPAGR